MWDCKMWTCCVFQLLGEVKNQLLTFQKSLKPFLFSKRFNNSSEFTLDWTAIDDWDHFKHISRNKNRLSIKIWFNTTNNNPNSAERELVPFTKSAFFQVWHFSCLRVCCWDVFFQVCEDSWARRRCKSHICIVEIEISTRPSRRYSPWATDRNKNTMTNVILLLLLLIICPFKGGPDRCWTGDLWLKTVSKCWVTHERWGTIHCLPASWFCLGTETTLWHENKVRLPVRDDVTDRREGYCDGKSWTCVMD